MEIRWEQERGWPSQLRTIKYRVSALVRKSEGFKIGMTNRPPTRAGAYGESYDEMIVLYETSSRKNAQELERKLIDYYCENYEPCENRRRGGGGPRGEGWYYVYVVRRS